MSLFRAGPGAAGIVVHRPAWPAFDSAPARTGPGEVGRERSVLPSEIYISEDLLRTARLQAAEALQEAAVEAEAAFANAHREGYETGHKEGLAAAHAELEALRERVQYEVDQARIQGDLIRQAAEAEAKATRAQAQAEAQAACARARSEADALVEAGRVEQRRRIDEVHPALVDLAVAAAVRIVQGHLAVQPESILPMVAAGLRRLKDTDCTVRVSPQELPLLEAQRATLEREMGSGLLRLQADANLGQGGYLVYSAQGQLDGRLEAQAVQLRTALSAALGDAAQ